MDASLDIEGTDKFLKIIRKLAKNNNIIIISHKADQIAQRFDRVIHFEKTKNFGKIKEAV
jgi:energy-coupling factor transporter ATP-binding protein EcfA2